MNEKLRNLYATLSLLGLVTACGSVKDKANEITNGMDVKGHWLMTQSEHSSQVEKAAENESMVLTFKDGQAAFSPTDTVKGHAVYAVISKCTAGPRAYRTDKNQFVFSAVVGCEEKRINVLTLDNTTLKFPDPDNTDIVRTFVRIDEAKYQQLVKVSERKPQ